MNVSPRRFCRTLLALALGGLSSVSSPSGQGPHLASLSVGVGANAQGDYVAATWRTPPRARKQQIVLERNLAGVFTQESTGIFIDREADVAMLPDGRHVLVGLGALREVLAKPYRPDASAIVDQVRVDGSAGTGTLTNDHPRVAMARSGSFVVVWSARDAGGGSRVYARRFTLAGVPRGQPFLVSALAVGNQSAPEIAMAKDGRFVVAWVGEDGDGAGIRAQVFDPSDQRVGVEAAVNARTGGEQGRPSIALDAQGSFFVAWTGPAEDGFSATWFRRFGADGFADTDDIPVLAGSQADIAVDPDGDVLVATAFQDYPETYFGDRGTITLQRFTNAGAPEGTPVGITDSGFRPYLALDADGDFIVNFTHGYDGDNDSFHHVTRRIAGSGEADLSLRQRALPKSIAPGASIDLKFKVSNETRPVPPSSNPTIDAGIGVANDVVVEGDLSPARLAGDIRTANPDWDCVVYPSSRIFCRYRRHLAAGTSVPLIVPATMPASPGQVPIRLEVSSTAQRDRRPGNNAPVVTLQVGEPCEPGRILFQQGPAIVREGSSIDIVVRRTGGSCGAVSAAYHTEDGTAIGGARGQMGIDYVAREGRLAWADGETATKLLPLASVEDSVWELDTAEVFRVVLGDPQDGPEVGPPLEIAIDDASDRPTVQFTANYALRVPEGTADFPIFVTMSKPSIQDMVIDLAVSDVSTTAGVDYNADPAMTLVIPAGQVQASRPLSRDLVDILADGVVEAPLERLQLTMTGTTGATIDPRRAVQNIHIQDLDAPPAVSFAGHDRTLGEGAVGASLDFDLSRPLDRDHVVQLSLDGSTAQIGTDFEITSGLSVTIPAGWTQVRRYSLNILTDGVSEGQELIKLTILPAEGVVIGDGVQLITIRGP